MLHISCLINDWLKHVACSLTCLLRLRTCSSLKWKGVTHTLVTAQTGYSGAPTDFGQQLSLWVWRQNDWTKLCYWVDSGVSVISVLTVSLLSDLTSIIPFSKFWHSGGIKWGIWKTPLFTFSRSCRRLSWSNGKAPYEQGGEKKDKTINEQDETRIRDENIC